MSGTVACRRCRRSGAPGLTAPTHPGALGDEIRTSICVDCWDEWRQVEVMVINELRLDFMDAGSGAILEQHLREFLGLDPPGPAA